MRAPRGRGLAWTAMSTLVGAVATLATSLGPGCSNGPLPHAFVGDLGPCEGQFAKQVDASECRTSFDGGAPACPGTTAYALCNGNTFNVCTCDLPSDYFLDGGTLDAGQGAPIPGAVPFLDGGGTDLPCCLGQIVYELPASECPAHCSGTKAYALCVGTSFTQCACDIPAGYNFSDLICPGDF